MLAVCSSPFVMNNPQFCGAEVNRYDVKALPSSQGLEGHCIPELLPALVRPESLRASITVNTTHSPPSPASSGHSLHENSQDGWEYPGNCSAPAAEPGPSAQQRWYVYLPSSRPKFGRTSSVGNQHSIRNGGLKAQGLHLLPHSYQRSVELTLLSS